MILDLSSMANPGAEKIFESFPPSIEAGDSHVLQAVELGKNLGDSALVPLNNIAQTSSSLGVGSTAAQLKKI